LYGLPPGLKEGITGNIDTQNNVYENLNVSGYFAGIVPARRGSTIINGGNWSNTYDVLLYTAAIYDRNVLINNLPATTKIATVYETNYFGLPGSIFFVKDTITLNFGLFVNQQLYFESQTANYVPFPVSRPDMPAQYIGLTNQQLWNNFGIALGGGIAPWNAFTVPGIVGLIAPRV
jgi:hypothetical protein